MTSIVTAYTGRSLYYHDDDHKSADQDVKILKPHRVRAYIENQLYALNASESKPKILKIRTITQQKKKEITKALNPQIKELKKWNDDMTYLAKTFKDYSDSDDEKKQNYELDGEVLLRQYTNCSCLLTAQQARREVVGEYIMPINEIKNSVKQNIKKYNAEVNSLQNKYDIIDTKYHTTMEKRIMLQEQIGQLVKELNICINTENVTGKQKMQTQNDLNVLKLEKKTFEKLWQTSKSLTAGYQKFVEDVGTAANEINTFFKDRMDFHERNWSKWQSKDVSNWIKYLNQTECENKIKLSNKIDLNRVTENIMAHGICGQTLDEIEKNDWCVLGVQLLADRTQINNRIQNMIKIYPRTSGTERETECKDDIQIPQQFKCPISGKIMIDPVQCSDNKTYERNNVKRYIQENGKLPGSADDYDNEDCVFKNYTLKREIDQFLTNFG